jgi:hypothetical protein
VISPRVATDTVMRRRLLPLAWAIALTWTTAGRGPWSGQKKRKHQPAPALGKLLYRLSDAAAHAFTDRCASPTAAPRYATDALPRSWLRYHPRHEQGFQLTIDAR